MPSIQDTLKKIGTEGTFAPKSKEPDDLLLHQYFIASAGRSFFQSNEKKIKPAVLRMVDKPLVKKVLNDTTKNMATNTAIVATTPNFMLELSTRIPSIQVDVDLLRAHLISAGVKTDLVDACITKASHWTKPAEVYRVKVR